MNVARHPLHAADLATSLDRVTTTRVPAALLLAVTAVLGACTPTAPTDDVAEPAAGCRARVGGGADVNYTGEPSEYDNLRYWTSADGSCSGPVVGLGTLIVAPTPNDAAFLCDALLGARVAGRIDRTEGPWSVPFGSMGFVCVRSTASG